MRLMTWFLLTLVAMASGSGLGRCDEADLPHEFDSLVPVYATARPVGTRYTRDSVVVHFAARAAFGQVAAYYDQALKASGWKVLKQAAGDKLVATKGRIDLSLMAHDEPQGFIIQLHYPGGRE